MDYRKTLRFLLFFLFHSALFAKTIYSQQTTFFKKVGAPGSNYWQTWTKTPDLGLIAALFRNDAVSDSTGCPTILSTDVNYILRVDSNGKTLWEKQSPWNEKRYDICINSLGTILCPQMNGIDKYTSSGAYIGTLPIYGHGYTLRTRADKMGNTYCLIRIWDSLNINGFVQKVPKPMPHYLIKLNSSDQVVWSKEINMIYDGNDKKFLVDDQNNILFTTSYYSNYVLFGDTLYKGNGQAIVKLNKNGNLIWSKSLNGAYPAFIRSDMFCNVYVAGVFVDSLNIDNFKLKEKRPHYYFKGDVYIAKLNTTDGKCAWVTQMTNKTAGESLNAFDVSPHGYCYLSCDGDRTNYLGDDSLDCEPYGYPWPLKTFLARLDQNGDLMWYTKGWGFWINNIEAVSDMGVYFCGIQSETFILDNDTIPNCNGRNNFILRKRFVSYVVGVAENSQNKSIQIFPNPARNTIRIKSQNNFREFVIKNIAGQVVMNRPLISEEIDINQAAGVYFLTLLGEHGTVTKKLVISE